SSRMLRSASVLLGDWAPLANCAITNVPGSRVPLYLQGARLTYVSALMPISDGMGLVFSVTGYNDTIVISFTACYEQVPDPEAFAQCLRDSFQEYLVLVRPALVVAAGAPGRARAPKGGRGASKAKAGTGASVKSGSGRSAQTRAAGDRAARKQRHPSP
ncbi:MAG: WS/DGAT domain-containing protein, partial [Rhodoferax sp.]